MPTGLTDLLGTMPIIQAPIPGWDDAQFAATVSQAGGLGSLRCAMWRPDEIRAHPPVGAGNHLTPSRLPGAGAIWCV